MLNIHRKVNADNTMAYTFYFQDGHEFESLLLYFNRDNVLFQRMYFDRTNEVYLTSLSKWKKFVKKKLDNPDDILFAKLHGFVIHTLSTHDGMRNVPFPDYRVNKDLVDKVVDIIEDYDRAFHISNATVIQTYYRRWRDSRRFSKARMRLLNEISLLPPKSIVPTFPGGSQYHAALEHFTVACAI